MIYLDFVPAADDCTVILLTHFDEVPLVNEPPYTITTAPGYGVDTTLKVFGDASFRANAAATSRTYQTVSYAALPGGGVPVGNGELTFEFRFRRSGGTGALSAGNQWQNDFIIDFTNGGYININAWNYFNAGIYHRGFYIALDDGLGGFDDVKIEDYDFLPDSDFHAIAYTFDGAGAYAVYVDGTRLASGTLTVAVPTGEHYEKLYFGNLLNTERMDEVRVTVGRIQYTGASYTLAATEFLTTACADTGGSTTTVLLDFDDVTPAPNIELTSPYHGFTVSDVWVVSGVTGGSVPNCIYQSTEASPANPVFEAADPISAISFGSLLVSGTLTVEARTAGGTLVRSDSVNTADSVWRSTTLLYAVEDAVKKLVFVGAVDSWLVDDLSITTVT